MHKQSVQQHTPFLAINAAQIDTSAWAAHLRWMSASLCCSRPASFLRSASSRSSSASECPARELGEWGDPPREGTWLAVWVSTCKAHKEAYRPTKKRTQHI